MDDDRLRNLKIPPFTGGASLHLETEESLDKHGSSILASLAPSGGPGWRAERGNGGIFRFNVLLPPAPHTALMSLASLAPFAPWLPKNRKIANFAKFLATLATLATLDGVKPGPSDRAR